MSEGAAQKRVSRALEKLRVQLTRRGVTPSAAPLAAALSAHAVQAAPAGLAGALSKAALAGPSLAATAVVTTTQHLTMTTLQKTILGVTLAVAVGTGLYEAHRASISRAQLRTLQQQQRPLAEQIEQLTRDRDQAASRLAALQHELARLRGDNDRLRRDAAELVRLRGEVARLRSLQQQPGPANPSPAETEDPFTRSVLDLTRRAGERSRCLERMPDKWIPELLFLTETDWQTVARDTSLETEADVRQALSRLRNVAKARFGEYATHALERFIAATNGQLPADLSELRPYFEVPVDDAVLQRWEVQIVPGADASHPGDNWVLVEKAPADPDYEKPLHVRGWGSLRGG